MEIELVTMVAEPKVENGQISYGVTIRSSKSGLSEEEKKQVLKLLQEVANITVEGLMKDYQKYREENKND